MKILPIHLIPTLLLFDAPSTAFAATALIWNSIADSVAVQTVEGPQQTCLSGKAYSVPDEGEGDFLKITPNKWHSGTILFGRKKTGYNCKLGDGSRPDLGAYSHLVFRAKSYNFDALVGCEPRLDFYGGSWPRKTSNRIVLKGSYVDRGELVDHEYRAVVVPTADLATGEFLLDQVQKLTFRNCPGMSGQRYDLQGIEMTDSPPAVLPPGGDGNDGTDGPTTSPTPEPTKGPTEEPTFGPLPDLVVYENVLDGYSAENSDQSCLYFADRGITSQISDPSGDSMVVQPDAWRSGGLSFGCLASTDGVCTHTCFQDGSRPDFSPYEALTFEATLDNADELVGDCKPSVKLYGGGSPAKESNGMALEGAYVDEGSLVYGEWRRVVIPLSDLRTSWDVDGVKSLRFLSCGTGAPVQPLYRVRHVRLTDSPLAVRSMSPSSSPTVRVTQDPSLATHFYYLNGWYPLVNKNSGTWLYAENNSWPDLPDSAPDGEYSVVIPAGCHVVYTGTPTPVKLNEVVVEDLGTLEISPKDGTVTTMTLSTLRVEEGGTLTILAAGPSLAIDIRFEGDIDQDADPTELLNGLVSFGGRVLIEGGARCQKVAEIVRAVAGERLVTLAGAGAATCWTAGEEIVLPDTQVGLDSGHYDFILSVYDSVTDSQLETARIESLEVVGDTTVVALDRTLSFAHLAGAHVAMVTRSISLSTCETSPSRAHILHTGRGSFDVKNIRINDMGRAGVEPFNSTTLEVDTSVELADGLAKMIVSKWGNNQAARYALHAHHSLVPMEFSGNVIMGGLRFGIVAHNSRVSILDNVVVGVEGSGILLEDGTETGDVRGNYIIGAGSGSGESDSARFTPSEGKEFGHGGFAIWSRTAYSSIEDNVAEGVFGESPYAFFLHINFMEHRTVPDVAGTPLELIGKTRGEVQYDVNNGVLSLNTYGSFRNNHCLGSYKRAFGANYFLLAPPEPQGHLLEDFVSVSLGVSGAGFSFGHSNRFTITGSLDAIADENGVVGVAVANGNLTIHDCNFTYSGVEILRSGCLECFTGQENCDVFVE